MSLITLAPVLDLPAAVDLKRELLEGFSASATPVIDASQVQRITTPALEVLAAAVRRGASIQGASPALADTAGILGLLAALNLEGSHV